MDPADLQHRRRQIAAFYTAAGFVLAMIALAIGSEKLGGDVPNDLALIFVGVIVAFAWIGGVVALELKPDALDWRPTTHRAAILKSLPVGIAAVATTLVASWIILTTGTEKVLFLPPVAFALWIRWRVGRAAV